ncbi:hypothetical protein B0T25DRAFT_517429 [Lasiosphaeria hispida]|uniref:Uncharacterized protein n=1 Tax=Lasiosphaeria hispida TaxID=260671 RepID=A0AAJ0MGX0_9PEZI|nr:hypothetical protein B0T25DRAFT_517429 [Lasiosphaeria hispida]
MRFYIVLLCLLATSHTSLTDQTTCSAHATIFDDVTVTSNITMARSGINSQPKLKTIPVPFGTSVPLSVPHTRFKTQSDWHMNIPRAFSRTKVSGVANLTEDLTKGRKVALDEIDSMYKLIKEFAGTSVNTTKFVDNMQAVIGDSLPSGKVFAVILAAIVGLAGLGRLVDAIGHALLLLWRFAVWLRPFIWEGAWHHRRAIWEHLKKWLARAVRDLRIRFGNKTLRMERERELQEKESENWRAEYWASVPKGTLGWSPGIDKWDAPCREHLREWVGLPFLSPTRYRPGPLGKKRRSARRHLSA